MRSLLQSRRWATADNHRVSIFLARPERPADGIPLAVKDLFDTAGLVTTYGSIVFAPSLSTSGETLTIEESMTLRARTETAGHVGDEHEWSQGRG